MISLNLYSVVLYIIFIIFYGFVYKTFNFYNYIKRNVAVILIYQFNCI